MKHKVSDSLWTNVMNDIKTEKKGINYVLALPTELNMPT